MKSCPNILSSCSSHCTALDLIRLFSPCLRTLKIDQTALAFESFLFSEITEITTVTNQRNNQRKEFQGKAEELYANEITPLSSSQECRLLPPFYIHKVFNKCNGKNKGSMH